ncbi:DUF4132 domain-containing protein [Nocardioides zeicaulis]|uniref:DUF4132 domain-containing protein n=1 Tax=Nocardioides zeicaulis TaxID=1776857 RepID=A0ABV6E4X7_9ACTN
MGWFSKVRAPRHEVRGTDAAWARVAAALTDSVTRDWRNPRPPDRRQQALVASYLLTGEVPFGQVRAVLVDPNGHYGTHFGAAYADLVEVCGAVADGTDVGEVDRWERLLHVMLHLEASRSGAQQPGPGAWVEALVGQLSHLPGLDTHGLTVGFVLALGDRFGASPDVVVAQALAPGAHTWRPNPVGWVMSRMPGWGALLAAHGPAVTPHLVEGAVDERLHTLRMLEGLSDSELAVHAAGLAVAATAGSAKVRDAARPLLLRTGEGSVERLLAIATEAKPDTRVHALSLLWQLGEDRPDLREEARRVAADDRAASVQALLGHWDAADTAPEPDEWDLPEEAPLTWSTDRTSADRIARTLVAGLAHEIDSLNQQYARDEQHRAARQGRPTPARTDRAVPGQREADAIAARLTDPAPPELAPSVLARHVRLPFVLMELAGDPALSPGVLLRCADEAHRLVTPRQGITWSILVEAAHRATGRPTLRELQRLLDAGGLQGAYVVWGMYGHTWDSVAREWPDDDVWPFVAANLDTLPLEKPSSWDQDPDAGYRALATLPRTPARVLDRLHEVALTGAKAERAKARRALAKDPGRAARCAAALSSGKADVRLSAAQWLTEIGDPAVVPLLAAAYAKERQDTVRGALLDALEAAGEDPATYLSRERLVADAEAAVAKGAPRELAWLDVTTLPDVRWSDGGPVPRALLEGLLVQAVRAKSPEPNAIVRRACAMFDRADAERFAERLLAAWLAEDLRPGPGGVPEGSAASSKGLLAVVGACAGQGVVAPAERYLREWYGMRASQGKALLAMLSWVDHPAAIQLVLSVGSRFRTKAFQDEAVRLAAALAERRGWTLDELADRTVPDLGLDRDGVLALPYRDRVFTAHLLADLTLQLRSPEGTVVKALPAPRQSDDAEAARQAKKDLASARKELKALARVQQDRLYEALCTGRTWPAGDWLDHLAAHPVLRHLVGRLVWLARPDDADDPRLVTFRPLEDGTLTDVDDAPVDLDPTWLVSLAHQTTLPAEAAEGWVDHLADYEVTPLFQQFGSAVWELPEDLRTATAITEFEGHLLEAFQLRGRALKLGWTRGPVEDAGWFHCYEKRFPGLGLTARLGFTGNGVPEENRTVALTRLEFAPTRDGMVQHASATALRDVPPVLLSECRNDMASLASLGPGHDPEWEKVTQL